MVTKSVKVYVSEEIHVVLSQIQEDLKEKMQKKVALSEILLEFAEKGMENFSKADFNIEKEEEVETIAITIHVSGKFYAILIQIQEDLKEKLQKKVALSEILLEFAKKGIKNSSTQNFIVKKCEKESFTQNKTVKSNEKESFTQNKNDFTQNEITNTQNYNAFTQNLVAKQLQNTQNEQYFDEKYNTFEQKKEELKVLEQDLKEFEDELKKDRENLYQKRLELLDTQEKVNTNLFKTKEKDLIIRQLKKEMIGLTKDFIEKSTKQTNEIYKLEQKNDRNAEKYKDKISELEREKRKLLYKLDTFEDTLKSILQELKDLKSSNNLLSKDLEHSNNSLYKLISKSKEKTLLDYIEPFLPAIITFITLNKDNIANNFKKLKNELSKPKPEKNKKNLK